MSGGSYNYLYLKGAEDLMTYGGSFSDLEAMALRLAELGWAEDAAKDAFDLIAMVRPKCAPPSPTTGARPRRARMADPRPAGERGESIRAEANRRCVSEWQVRKDRGATHGRRFPSDDRTQTSFRLPAELHERLQAAAEDRDLSVNYLVNKAVEEFLPRLLPASQFRATPKSPKFNPPNREMENDVAAHDHTKITAVDHNTDPAGFMKAFLAHVRDDHGHSVDHQTPWQKVEDLHRAGHAARRTP